MKGFFMTRTEFFASIGIAPLIAENLVAQPVTEIRDGKSALVALIHPQAISPQAVETIHRLLKPHAERHNVEFIVLQEGVQVVKIA